MAPIRGDSRVVVHGIDEFRRDLKALDDRTILRELGDEFYRIADHVSSRARARLSAYGAMYARAATTIRPARSQMAARIAFGNNAVPFAGGAEFGAYPDRPRTRSTGTYKGYAQFGGAPVKGGRSIYPTAAAESDWMRNAVDEGMARVLARAFPERT